MGRPTPDPDDLLVASFERALRGEKRVLLQNAPRDDAGVKKLTDWQVYCLAAALGVTDACVKVYRQTYDKLPRGLRDRLLVEELKSYDDQRYTRKSFREPAYWSDLMQKYLREELERDDDAA